MTINEFISKLNKEKVDVWWEQLQPEKVPQKAKDANWKYFLTRADKRVEFKWSLRDLAKFYNLDFNKFNFTDAGGIGGPDGPVPVGCVCSVIISIISSINSFNVISSNCSTSAIKP